MLRLSLQAKIEEEEEEEEESTVFTIFSFSNAVFQIFSRRGERRGAEAGAFANNRKTSLIILMSSR